MSFARPHSRSQLTPLGLEAMPHQFIVSAAAATREEWGWLVVLGDIEQMDGSPYLRFQLAHECTEDDKRLGHDQSYIEINNQGWSWYGHVERVELRRNEVTVQMDREAQDRMENDGLFVFRFAADEPRYKQVERALSRIFAGNKAYTASAA